LDILVLVNGNGSVGMVVELDPEERTWSSKVVQSELCFQCSLYLVYIVRGGCSNEKVIDVDADHAVGFIEHAVVRLCHGEAMSGQDEVDALVPNPRGLLESIQGTMKLANTSWFFEAFGQLHVDGRVYVPM
jgi:hypothetical protein